MGEDGSVRESVQGGNGKKGIAGARKGTKKKGTDQRSVGTRNA
jgi:hypothetical protein